MTVSIRITQFRPSTRWVLLLLTMGVPAACGRSGQSGQTGVKPDRPAAIDVAADPSVRYRAAGMIAHSGVLPFTGIVHYFASDTPDTTLALIALSLSNRSLTFVGEGNEYRARYRVSIEVRTDSVFPRQLESRQEVRVGAYRETTRGDASIVFQHFIVLPPGEAVLYVSVRDEGSPRAGGSEITLRVPHLTSGSVSSPVLVYDAEPRASVDSQPEVIANPRSTVVFGRDSVLSLYLEAYGLTGHRRVALLALSDRGARVWSDTVSLAQGRTRGLAAALLRLPVSNLGAGQMVLAATAVGSTDTLRVPLFVSFGEDWAITSFEEMLDYLRYFATLEEMSELRDATPSERAAAWSAFWKVTDPVPTTPENEALRDYFARVRVANERFTEEGGPGWLTDRGRVLLMLGDPDEIYEQADLSVRQRGRGQIWVYNRFQVQIVFVDQTGFGRWRLTTASEIDLQAAARQRRR